MMLQFKYEIVLYFLWVPFVLWFISTWIRKKRILALNQNFPNWQKLLGMCLRPQYEIIFFCLAIFFLMIGLADPRIGTKVEKVERRGADIVFVLDISRSMDATDVSPSRLELAKFKINRILDKLTNDRVALIFLSSRPYLQIPLTIDVSILRTWLQAVDSEVLPGGGTDIGAALLLAAEQFDEDPARDKGIVLLTDGEDHEGNLSSAIEELKKAGIRLYILGIGTLEGGPIPLRNRAGQFKTDASGQLVITQLKETVLRSIAEKTNGRYIRVRGDEGDVSFIVNGVFQLDKKKIAEKIVTEYESRGLWFVTLGAFLLLLDRVLPIKRKYNIGLIRNLYKFKSKSGWSI
ncbi:MAG: VWA domain-containing protein [bacterium]|nr:VWA domain-containing protein [bacterium]